MAKKAAKAPKVSYTLLLREEHEADYQRLDALVEAHHDDIRGASIALAWCNSWRADPDGIKTLGKCKKASALDRELHIYDFVILLNQDFWTHELTTDLQRDALLDHELCHATVKEDKFGDPLRDERHRIIYRIRKHDLEEFACIVERHGLWKRDLETFAQALRRSADQPKLPMEQAPPASAPRMH
jgi:hypothetical protein